MPQKNWVLQIIAGILIVGVVIVGIALFSFIILPLLGLLIIGVPLYLWLKNRRGSRKGRSAGKNEVNVERSRYDVLDDEESSQDGTGRADGVSEDAPRPLKPGN